MAFTNKPAFPKFLLFLFFLIPFLCTVSASPLTEAAVQNAKHWKPKFITPEGGEKWKVGSSQVVKWDLSDMPKDEGNKMGILKLSNNEHIGPDDSLVANFHLSDGEVTITIPEREKGDHYQVVLIEESSSWSPAFTIEDK